MSTMSDREIIAWARQYGALSAMMGDDDGAKLRRLADLAEKGAEDWQPIATAPTDGTKVLMCHGDWFGLGRIEGEECRWGFIPIPTHWRPLPAPPGGER